jgi:hypothetical protein
MLCGCPETAVLVGNTAQLRHSDISRPDMGGHPGHPPSHCKFTTELATYRPVSNNKRNVV